MWHCPIPIIAATRTTSFRKFFLIYFRVKPQFNDEEHRKAWLIRTTINCSLRVVDSTYRKRTVPMDEMDEGSFQFESKEENAVHLALRQLPEKYRIVLQLFYFEDMSIDSDQPYPADQAGYDQSSAQSRPRNDESKDTEVDA